MIDRIIEQPFCQSRVIGCFYHVNIIGTGTLLLKWGFHKYDFYEKEPCFLTDEGYKVSESDYDTFVFAF
jgi:hypothetical protein